MNLSIKIANLYALFCRATDMHIYLTITMKKICLPILMIILLPLSYSCGTLKSMGYSLTEADAAPAG